MCCKPYGSLACIGQVRMWTDIRSRRKSMVIDGFNGPSACGVPRSQRAPNVVARIAITKIIRATTSVDARRRETLCEPQAARGCAQRFNHTRSNQQPSVSEASSCISTILRILRQRINARHWWPQSQCKPPCATTTKQKTDRGYGETFCDEFYILLW